MLIAFLLSLFGLILLNVPIAIVLILTSVILMLLMDTVSAHIVAQSVVRGIDNFPLMAIPLFMLAGELMNVGGISQRIVEFAKGIFGQIRGALGYVVTTASMIFAGVSGSAIADTSAIGSIMLPIMRREGYNIAKSTALVCASGCTGPIIPPSIPMILFGVIGGVSVVKLFLGGIIPGLILGFTFMLVWYFHARTSDYPIGAKVPWREKLTRTRDAFWALILPIIIMGGIISGIYTPTEAAVVAVVYTFFIGKFIYKELKYSDLPDILVNSAKSTAIVLFLCGAAMSAGYLLTTAHVPDLLLAAIDTLSGGNIYLAVLWINIFMLIVGCVMDLTPALLILAPMLLPVAQSYGLDPVAFGVMLVFNLCVGLVTPPVGTVLYIGCGLSKLTMQELTRPLMPFIIAMVAVLMLISYVPGLILFIPNMVR